jgi:P pilus assembly chaperone PapD
MTVNMIARFPYFIILAGVLFTAQPALSAEDENPPIPELSNGGAGDLLVAPTRVVLEGRARAAEVILSNKSSKESTYRISFTHLRMKQDGSYEELQETDARSTLKIADDILRYSPRQVTLKPGESQVVKVMVRKSENTTDGEYTSHLLFRAVPDLATGTDVEAKAEDNSKISIRLVPVYGVSIPVIVRQGDLSAQAKLGDAHRTQDSVEVTISRTGTKSVYGDIALIKDKEIVAEQRGVAVMAYNTARTVTIPVKDLPPGPLTIEYRERSEDGGRVIDRLSLR